MPRCSSRSARTSAKRGMFCIANSNVPPCHATSIVASVRFASCTVRTNEAIRSGNVHSVLLKNTRTYRGPSAITLVSRSERFGGGPLMSANTCWLNCPPKPPNQLTRPWSRASVNSGGAVGVPAPSAGPGEAMRARLAAIAQASVGTRATPKRRIPGRHPTTHAPFTVMAGDPRHGRYSPILARCPPGARGTALPETTHVPGWVRGVPAPAQDHAIATRCRFWGGPVSSSCVPWSGAPSRGGGCDRRCSGLGRRSCGAAVGVDRCFQARCGRPRERRRERHAHPLRLRTRGRVRGHGVTVGLLDTGIDEHNPDLADAVVAEHCFVPPDGCPDGTAEQDGPGSAQDDQGHGTEMAGLITGNGTTAPIGVRRTPSSSSSRWPITTDGRRRRRSSPVSTG